VKNKKLKCNLKKIRFLEGEMTQEELAKKVGVSRQTIIAIEKGRYTPSVYLALKISKVLNKKVEEIFELEGL
jgi:putative transcriptional regulator